MSFLHKAITMHFPLEGMDVLCLHGLSEHCLQLIMKRAFKVLFFSCGSQILWQDLRVAESEWD